MKLHENQLRLIQHLARYNLMNYRDCLDMLDTENTGNLTALSYAFRPLTKNGYIAKRKDNSVAILAKGRALFPEITPLLTVGGGTSDRNRVMIVSRMAALLERNGVPSFRELQEADGPYFIPSACWRNIAPGILSTTRFTGMLVMEDQRLAVYDIGNGTMEWQVRAEGSLFYTRYGRYETKATGMLFVCQDEKRNEIAENIIRQTMWNRRQLLSAYCVERNRPVRWSRSPIKLRAQYEHVYLTTPIQFKDDLIHIYNEKWQIERQSAGGTNLYTPAQGDYERWPYRFFCNYATDLLKYVYFFSEVKALLISLSHEDVPKPKLRYAICCWEKDFPILRMYPDVWDLEGLKLYEYRS